MGFGISKTDDQASSQPTLRLRFLCFLESQEKRKKEGKPTKSDPRR